jgi:hypothetical protein
MPVLLKPGTLTAAPPRPGIAPAAFNSRLTHPLFTELANLLQNALFATGQMGLQSPELRIPKQSLSNFARFSLRFQSVHGKYCDSILRAFRIHE